MGLDLTSLACPLALACYAPVVDPTGGFYLLFAWTLLLPTLISYLDNSSSLSPDLSLNVPSCYLSCSSCYALLSYYFSNLPSSPSSLSLATCFTWSSSSLWKLNFPVPSIDLVLKGVGSSMIGYSSFYYICSIYLPSYAIRSTASSGMKSGQAFFVDAGITVPSAFSTNPMKLFYRLSSLSSFKFIATSISFAIVSASSVWAAFSSSSSL